MVKGGYGHGAWAWSMGMGKEHATFRILSSWHSGTWHRAGPAASKIVTCGLMARTRRGRRHPC
eukprot:352827-Chlamydomonas_euryale.AAC.3